MRSDGPSEGLGVVGLPYDANADAAVEADPRLVSAPSPEDDARPGPAVRHLLNSKRCGLSKAALADRIVGGAVAALGHYPWLARIGYNCKSQGQVETQQPGAPRVVPSRCSGRRGAEGVPLCGHRHHPLPRADRGTLRQKPAAKLRIVSRNVSASCLELDVAG